MTKGLICSLVDGGILGCSVIFMVSNNSGWPVGSTPLLRVGALSHPLDLHVGCICGLLASLAALIAIGTDGGHSFSFRRQLLG